MTRIGVVGGGQLARMMAEPAKKLGYSLTVLDPLLNSPAGQLCDFQIIAEYNDANGLLELAKRSDVVTIEVEVANEENLSQQLIAIDKHGHPVHPSPQTLRIIQDKLKQKQFLKKARIPTPEFTSVTTVDDIKKAAEHFGYPVFLKVRTGAYDGRGNYLLTKEEDINDALAKLGTQHLYIEQYVPFTKEIAIMVGRNTNGDIAAYPVVETIHHDNILHMVLAPAGIDKQLYEKATQIGKKVLEELKGAGMFGIEMFLTTEGQILINEIAPRVHNSGHYTIEACKTSQFEQHLRAITGMPLGSTTMSVHSAVMVNILGRRNGKVDLKGLDEVKKIPGVSVHIYGKLETRFDRKMGHITAVAKTLKEAKKNALRAREIIQI